MPRRKITRKAPMTGYSLLVVYSLLEREGMAGKLQMIYVDSPTASLGRVMLGSSEVGSPSISMRSRVLLRSVYRLPSPHPLAASGLLSYSTGPPLLRVGSLTGLAAGNVEVGRRIRCRRSSL
jgi:hypothetical protein